uniref:Uncharacterized protein n=1 Tax=Romanomermis culicivorax TaxID=13658 RepID=A0A915KT44_ROMCU
MRGEMREKSKRDCRVPLTLIRANVVLVVTGADGDVNDTISCMASRNLSLCKGLEIPISRCIS